MALAAMLPMNKIHHFADIGIYYLRLSRLANRQLLMFSVPGYNHAPASRCPQDDASHLSGRCYCNRGRNYDNDNYSCGPRWFALNGVGTGAVMPPHLPHF
jgi:hypothetical protein